MRPASIAPINVDAQGEKHAACMKATRSRDVAAGTTALAALGNVDASNGSSSESVGVVGMELSADLLMATLL